MALIIFLPLISIAQSHVKTKSGSKIEILNANVLEYEEEVERRRIEDAEDRATGRRRQRRRKKLKQPKEKFVFFKEECFRRLNCMQINDCNSCPIDLRKEEGLQYNDVADCMNTKTKIETVEPKLLNSMVRG